MKANKAPKEIYLLPDDRNPDGLSICWYEAPYCTGAIEYTRTDAFIKKAISWLKEQNEIIGVSFQEDFLKRFKDYMKGE